MTHSEFDTSDSSRAETVTLLTTVLECQEESSFLSLLQENSELLSDDLQVRTAELRNEVDFWIILGLVGELLLESRADPRRAWRDFRLQLEQLEVRATELSPRLDEIDRVLAEGRFEEVLVLTDAARPVFAATGAAFSIGRMHAQRGLAYAQLLTGNPRLNTDKAILELRAAQMLTPDPARQAQDLMQLGLAFGRRAAGDRAENLENEVDALGEALVLAADAGNPELLARVRTHQASALLRRERGDALENRRIAAALCRDALEFRNPSRDAIDWASSQLTLADALDALAILKDLDQNAAVVAYTAVVNVAALKSLAPWTHAVAHHGIARIFLRNASAILDDRPPGDDSVREPPPEVNEWLHVAREHLKEAVELDLRVSDANTRGRALADLARTSARLGNLTEALTYGEEALELLTPATDAYECSRIAWAVAEWLSDLGRWEEASTAFRTAIEAAEVLVHARVSNEAREQEMERFGNMYRWASYALARAGHREEAAFVLDIGRSRELRRRLGVDEYSDPLIDLVPEDLRETYEAAIGELSSSSFGQDGSDAGERLQRVLSEIRSIPGLSNFAAAGAPDRLFGSIEGGWPIIYINPTPRGLCLLRIALSAEGPSVDTLLLDGPRSLEVLMRIVGGVSSTKPEDWHEGELVSYVREASGFADGTGAELVEALDSLLPWIGETIIQPLWEFAEQPGIRGLTLIPCGPLALAPLAVCPWVENAQRSCLLDHAPVRYPPSALIASACLHRAAEADAGERILLGLADPERDDPEQHLPGAGPELRAIARLFNPTAVHTEEGNSATSVFLRTHAETCSHLHLACHGKGEVTDASEALVWLADTAITAEELAGLPLRGSRLVVLSACQTAVQQLNDMPDEALSVSTSFLAAGTACVIASLWSVDDAATAMLMVRVYERMMLNHERPPEALRNAQLWLRDLSPEDELAFLEEHPELYREWLRRRDAGDPVGRGISPLADAGRFAHPAFWAPFVAAGV